LGYEGIGKWCVLGLGYQKVVLGHPTMAHKPEDGRLPLLVKFGLGLELDETAPVECAERNGA